MAKKKKPNKIQLLLELDTILTMEEDKFILKLTAYFKRVTARIFKKIENSKAFTNTQLRPDKEDLKELSAIMGGYYKKIGKHSIKSLNDEIASASLKRVSKIRIPNIDAGLRYRAEQLSIKKLKEFEQQLIDKVNLSPGIKQAKADVIDKIRKSSNLYINRNVKIVSRMESVKAANYQRLQAMHKSTIVKGVQFLAIMDDRTTDICIPRHLKVLKLDDPLLDAEYLPPLHFGCRSLLSPVLIYEKDLNISPQKDLKSVPAPDFGKEKQQTKIKDV